METATVEHLRRGGPLRAAVRLPPFSPGSRDQSMDEAQAGLMTAYSTPLDAETKGWLLEAAATGDWHSAHVKLTDDAARTYLMDPESAGEMPTEVLTALPLTVAVMLEVQAATAPLPIAAAAACLLAHHHQVTEATAASFIAAEPRAAVRISQALARPGFLAAMAACKNAQHAAGMLAVTAVYSQAFADGSETAPMPPPALAVALAPVLPAALAAPNSNACGTQMEQLRRVSAAKLLQAVAQQAGHAPAAMSQQLRAAAAFLMRLRADMEAYVYKAPATTGTERHSSRVDGAGGGSSGHAHVQLSDSIVMTTLNLKEAFALATAGTIALLAAVASSKTAAADAAVAAAAAAAARVIATNIGCFLKAIMNIPESAPPQYMATARLGLRCQLWLDGAPASEGVNDVAAVFRLAGDATCRSLYRQALDAAWRLHITYDLLPAVDDWSVLCVAWVARRALPPSCRVSPWSLEDVSAVVGGIKIAEHQRSTARLTRGRSNANCQQQAADVRMADWAESELVTELLAAVSVPPDRQPAADVLDVALEELAGYLSRPRPDNAFTHVYMETMYFVLDSRRLSEVEAAPLATRLSWQAGLLQLLCAAVDVLTPESMPSSNPPGQSADAAAHQPISSRSRLARPAKAAANQSASSRQPQAWPAAGAAASAPLLLKATSAFVESAGRWSGLLRAIAGEHPVAILARAARPALAAACDRYPPAAAAAWAAMFSRAMAELIAADPDVKDADQLLQRGGPAEWAPAEAALAATAAAVPKWQRRTAELNKAIAAALQATPAGQAAAWQQQAAAAAAANSAAQQLLQDELQDEPREAPAPSKAAAKRATKKAAARAAAAAAAAAPVGGVSSALDVLQPASGTPAAAEDAGRAMPAAEPSSTSHQQPAAASPAAGGRLLHRQSDAEEAAASGGGQRSSGGDGGGAATEASHAPQSKQSPPSWQLCPLTQAIMVDPVLLLADSHTYERSAIVAWLAERSTSPVTGQPLESKEVVPNHTLRSLISGLAALRT